MPQIIESTLTVTDHTSLRGHQVLTLIGNNIQGFTTQFYDWRVLGTSPDYTFPAVSVVPESVVPVMYTLGKWRTKFNFFIYWFCTENDLTIIPDYLTYVGWALKKLFSNNANGDLSGQHKMEPNFWFNSELGSIKYGRIFKNPDEPTRGGMYIQVGMVPFYCEDQIQI
jgi:hypothetical protein